MQPVEQKTGPSCSGPPGLEGLDAGRRSHRCFPVFVAAVLCCLVLSAPCGWRTTRSRTYGEASAARREIGSRQRQPVLRRPQTTCSQGCRPVRDAEVASSNPAHPTRSGAPARLARFLTDAGHDSVHTTALPEGTAASDAFGFPVCTATVRYPRRGYDAMFGWVQLVHSTDNQSGGQHFEMDPFARFGDVRSPYCWYGTEPTLVDAPSRQDRAPIEWIAYSFLATTPIDDVIQGSPRRVVPLLGFEWGFDIRTEAPDCRGAYRLFDRIKRVGSPVANTSGGVPESAVDLRRRDVALRGTRLMPSRASTFCAGGRTGRGRPHQGNLYCRSRVGLTAGSGGFRSSPRRVARGRVCL
jgi:hypothetical protein